MGSTSRSLVARHWLGVEHVLVTRPSVVLFPLCFGVGLIEPKPLCVLEAFHAWAINSSAE